MNSTTLFFLSSFSLIVLNSSHAAEQLSLPELEEQARLAMQARNVAFQRVRSDGNNEQAQQALQEANKKMQQAIERAANAQIEASERNKKQAEEQERLKSQQQQQEFDKARAASQAYKDQLCKNAQDQIDRETDPAKKELLILALSSRQKEAAQLADNMLFNERRAIRAATDTYK